YPEPCFLRMKSLAFVASIFCEEMPPTARAVWNPETCCGSYDFSYSTVSDCCRLQNQIISLRRLLCLNQSSLALFRGEIDFPFHSPFNVPSIWATIVPVPKLISIGKAQGFPMRIEKAEARQANPRISIVRAVILVCLRKSKQRGEEPTDSVPQVLS